MNVLVVVVAAVLFGTGIRYARSPARSARSRAVLLLFIGAIALLFEIARLIATLFG